MTDKQIIIDEQMENLNNLATQQLKRIEEEKRQIEHIAKTHLVETFDMQREIDKLKKELQAKEQELQEAMDNYVKLDNQRVKEYNELVDKYNNKEQECEFSNLKIIQLQETLSQYETDLSTKDCIVETCKAQYNELKAENENWQKEYWKLEQGNDFLAEKNSRLRGCLAEIKDIAEPYQKDIDKICGNCRRYDGCHACCMDTLNNYEYRTGTTKACDKFIELKDFDINKLANQILQKISECEGNDG